MRRARGQERSHGGSAAQTLLVVTLTLTVLWQVGGRLTDPPVPEPQPGVPVSEPSAPRTFFTTTDVNVRAGPGTSHDVLSVLPGMTEVTVIGAEEQGFARVEIQGREAWVSVDYIAPEGSVRASTVEMAHPVEGIVAPPEPMAVPTEAPVDVAIVGDEIDGEEQVESLLPLSARTVHAGEMEVAAPEPELVDVPAGERWVEVDRSTAKVTLHEGDTIVAVYQGKIGKDPSDDGFYATAIGTFHVFSMNRELTETPFAPGVYLTDWVGFDPERSNGFHSPVRDENGDVVITGGTTTLGCVRLGEDEARQVFDFAFIGMRVEIHD